MPGDVICNKEITAAGGYRVWVILYWVKQANREFVQVTATIAVSTTTPVPPGGRPILSWAHFTPPSITDGCAPSHSAPAFSYFPWLRGFLDAGFAVVGTDYIGLGTPGVHPYLVGKSEGAAVLAAARAAHEFSLAEASGPVIIYGHSQGGHAALYADWQAQYVSFYAPGVDVRGVIASAPPTFLGEIASRVLSDPTDLGAVMNLLIASGSWHRLYGPDYPDVLKGEGKEVANAASDPDAADCYNLPGGIKADDLVSSGALPVKWTDLLGMNSAPVGLLPRTIPLLVVQGTNDKQVPYPVTRAAVQDICESGVPVKFDVIQNGNHGAPLTDVPIPPSNEPLLSSILSWAQQRIRGESVENSCGSLPG